MNILFINTITLDCRSYILRFDKKNRKNLIKYKCIILPSNVKSVILFLRICILVKRAYKLMSFHLKMCYKLQNL